MVKVSADYSEAQKAVQAFVDQYNSVMAFIQDKLKYDKDTKAKGDLFADPTLQGIQSRLRNMVAGSMNNPTGPFKILAEIGITTSSDNFGKSASLSSIPPSLLKHCWKKRTVLPTYLEQLPEASNR